MVEAETPQEAHVEGQAEEEKSAEKPVIEKGAALPQQVEEILEGEYYSIKYLASQLGYTTAWITALCQDGRIRAVKPLGGQWRIPKSEVKRLTKEGIPPVPRAVSDGKPPTEIEVPKEIADKVAPHPKEEDEVRKETERNPYWPLPVPWKSK